MVELPTHTPATKMALVIYNPTQSTPGGTTLKTLVSCQNTPDGLATIYTIGFTVGFTDTWSGDAGTNYTYFLKGTFHPFHTGQQEYFNTLSEQIPALCTLPNCHQQHFRNTFTLTRGACPVLDLRTTRSLPRRGVVGSLAHASCAHTRSNQLIYSADCMRRLMIIIHTTMSVAIRSLFANNAGWNAAPIQRTNTTIAWFAANVLASIVQESTSHPTEARRRAYETVR